MSSATVLLWQVLRHGAVPDHVHILGNDFLKKVKARLGFEDQLMHGTNPAGEDFTIPVTIGGRKRSQWCNAVEVEEQDQLENGISESGSAFLMNTCTIIPGETVKIEAQIWGLDSEEQRCMVWEPVQIETEESPTFTTPSGSASPVVVCAVDGVTTYVAIEWSCS